MNSHSRPYAAGSNSSMSQQGLYQDTGYYGQAGGASSTPHGPNDIPLQDQAGKGPDFNDHIYDAPEGAQRRPRSKKGKVRIGELGMFGADRKRIPWITYIFTIAQVGVFIGEVIKNGTSSSSP